MIPEMIIRSSEHPCRKSQPRPGCQPKAPEMPVVFDSLTSQGFVLHQHGEFALMAPYGVMFARVEFLKAPCARITWLANWANRQKFAKRS